MDLWLAEEWVQALDEGREPVINSATGAATMEMVHGAYAAHALGRRVELPQGARGHPLQDWLRREGRPDPGPAPKSYADWIGWALEEARRA